MIPLIQKIDAALDAIPRDGYIPATFTTGVDAIRTMLLSAREHAINVGVKAGECDPDGQKPKPTRPPRPRKATSPVKRPAVKPAGKK